MRRYKRVGSIAKKRSVAVFYCKARRRGMSSSLNSVMIVNAYISNRIKFVSKQGFRIKLGLLRKLVVNVG